MVTNIASIECFAVLFHLVTASRAFAVEIFHSGRIAGIRPVDITELKLRSINPLFCEKMFTTGRKRFQNALFGSLFGSVIGNEISDTPGFGTLGEVFPFQFSQKKNQASALVYEDCSLAVSQKYIRTYKFSHYEVKVNSAGAIVHLKTMNPYRIGEQVRLFL